MTDPVLHSADPVAATVDLMEHHVLHLDNEHKQEITAEIAAGDSKVIMFVRTKHGADRLAKQLAARRRARRGDARRQEPERAHPRAGLA